MSDFVPPDNLGKLWLNILDLHWIYLNAEESIPKLESRKKLEDCLKEFVCQVQHDKKFFLPETLKVLSKSVQDLKDFNPQKAISAFDSISQYASNLYTKPWRKEFHTLKMYSGFYQHEVKSNLSGAEILFEAMGYQRYLTDDTLILAGPICPEQVENVSRDAMIAYVELQIMRHIYNGLAALGIHCSYLDIYRHREKSIDSPAQAIRALAHAIEEKRFRSSEKQMIEDNYGYIDTQLSSNYFTTNTQCCPTHCQTQINLCQKILPTSNYRSVAETNMAYPAHFQHHLHQGVLKDSGGFPLPQMSHSRSLDHYSEPASNHHHNTLSHHHSFDHQKYGCAAHQQNQYLHQQQQQHQQQHYYTYLLQNQQNMYDSTYDCIDENSVDGGSINCKLNSNVTYSHPYNVSGNRYPLPFNISNQFSANDNLQSSDYKGSQEAMYARISDQHTYSSVSKSPHNCMVSTDVGSYNQSSISHGLQNSLLGNSFERKFSCKTEELINFEEPTQLPPITSQEQYDHLNQMRKNCDTFNHIRDAQYNTLNIMDNSIDSTVICQQPCIASKSITNNDVHMYAKPTPRGNRKLISSHSREYVKNYAERGDIADISYESANDDVDVNLPPKQNGHNHSTSPTQFSRNQDGIGSGESWDNVYQSLERNVSCKDCNERNDLLIQSLDLESLNIDKETSINLSNSTDKRKSDYPGNENKTAKHRQNQTQQSNRTFQNEKHFSKNKVKTEISVCKVSANNIQKQNTSLDNNVRKIKSIPTPSESTTKSTANTKPKTNDNKTFKSMNNNNDSFLKKPADGVTQRKTSTVVVNTPKKSPSFVISTNAPPQSTKIIVTGANEWSCSYCTFINENTTTNCEICSNKRKLDINTTKPSKATGGATVTHNTPTCA